MANELSITSSLRVLFSEQKAPVSIGFIEHRVVIVQTIILEGPSSIGIVIKDWHQGKALIAAHYVSIILFLYNILHHIQLFRAENLIRVKVMHMLQ